MVYIDGAYDSKAYGSINHFEIPLSGIRGHVIGHNQKKDTHTLPLGLKQLTSLIFRFAKNCLGFPFGEQPPNIQHAVPLVHAELLTKVLTVRTRFCLLAGMRVAWLRRGTTRKAGNHTQREQELYRLHKRRLLFHAKTTLSIRMVLTY